MDGIEGVDTSKLKSALADGDLSAIMQEAQALRAIGKQFKTTAKNVLKVAGDWSEVDSTELEEAIASGNLADIRTATKGLGAQIVKQKKFEASISDLIPDAHDWHKQFTAAELQGAYDILMLQECIGYGYGADGVIGERAFRGEQLEACGMGVVELKARAYDVADDCS